jgi:OOP family OmpA-OmpF porin
MLSWLRRDSLGIANQNVLNNKEFAMKKLIVAMIAAAAAMSAAQAQNAYVGAAVSTSDTSFRGAPNASGDDGYKAYGKIYGGYEINPMWAVEAGYTGRVEADGSRTYVAAKATMPVNEQVSLYGKLGVGYTKTDVNYTAARTSFDQSDTEAYGALGAKYKINEQVALTLEYERYGKKKDFGARADAIALGAQYSF